MLIGSDDWRGDRQDKPGHEARTPWQIAAVIVVVLLLLVIAGALVRGIQ